MRITKNRLGQIAFILILISGTCLADPDIYRWVDDHGVVNFSEMPDANGKSEKVSSGVTIAEADKSDAKAETVAEQESDQTTAVEHVSQAEQIREQRATAQEDAAAKKAKLEENCKNAEYIISRLEPSPRVMTTNEAGEVVRMDDDERLRKLNEAKAYLSANCNK